MSARIDARRAWWITFAAFLALGSLWAFASPLYSVTDEAAHTVRAAAAVRGQILPGEPTEKHWVTWADVPEAFEWPGANCYLFYWNEPAGCAGDLYGSEQLIKVATSSGYYPPAYFAVMGLPTLWLTSATGIFAIRLINAGICAALLASSFASLWEHRCHRLAFAGTALAITPTLLYTAGSVNPSGIEIAGAICLWTATACLLSHARGPNYGRLLTRIAVAGSAITLSRPASVAWVILIPVIVLAWAGRHRAVELLRSRHARIAAGVIAAASATTVVWVTIYDTLERIPGGGSSAGHSTRTSATRLAAHQSRSSR